MTSLHQAPSASKQTSQKFKGSPRQMLVAFYEQYNAAKVLDVDRVLEKYQGNEEQMFRNVAKKYNVDPSVFGLSRHPTNVVEALTGILDSEEICNVHLKGTDGIEVPASRIILSAWSPVLSRMCFGSYAEASSSVIEVDYSSHVIRQIKEFCYTNRFQDMSIDQTNVNEAFLKDMVSLANAAHYYEIIKLEETVLELLNDVMKTIPWTSCYLFEATLGKDTELHKQSYEFICQSPEKTLGTTRGLKCFSEQSIDKVLQEQKINESECFLFECLQRWVEAGEEGEEEGVKVEAEDSFEKVEGGRCSNDEQTRSSSAAAQRMVRHIKLDRIQPFKLLTDVKASGIVNEKALLEAYEQQVMSFAPVGGVKLESTGIWSVSRSKLCHGLTVTLQGAGSAGANGKYALVGLCHGLPEYRKYGNWENQKCIFSLYCLNFEAWYVGVSTYDDDIFKDKMKLDDAVNLYVNTSMKESSGDIANIPITGWRNIRDEYGPPPTIKFVFKMK